MGTLCGIKVTGGTITVNVVVTFLAISMFFIVMVLFIVMIVRYVLAMAITIRVTIVFTTSRSFIYVHYNKRRTILIMPFNLGGA